MARDEQGKALYVLGFLLDITEQRQLEEALRAREVELAREKEYYEALVTLSPTAIVTLDLERRVTAWNAAATRLFGYAEAEALGQPIDTLVETVAVEAERPAYDWMTQGRTQRARTCLRRDGTRVDVELIAAPLVFEGEPLGELVVFHDVTAVRRTETRFRRVVEELPIATYIDAAAGTAAWSEEHVQSAAGESLYISPQFEQMSGYPAEAWKDGLLWERILHPDDRDWVLEISNDEALWLDNRTIEYRMLRPDGMGPRLVRLREGRGRHPPVRAGLLDGHHAPKGARGASASP